MQLVPCFGRCLVSTAKSWLALATSRHFLGRCFHGAHRPPHSGCYNNIGSGYWGNHLNGAGTFYLTKGQGTTANIMADWELHGSKTTYSGNIYTMLGTLPLNVQVTPGAAFSDEWALVKLFLWTSHF